MRQMSGHRCGFALLLAIATTTGFYQRGLAQNEAQQLRDIMQRLDALQQRYSAAVSELDVIRKTSFGGDSNHVIALTNQIEQLQKQGNYGAAVAPSRELVAIAERVLGAHHPTVAATLNNLAVTYKELGNFSEAIPLYQRSLAIREQALGANHSDVATSLNNLANLYTDQGNYGEALPLYQRALAIREQALGKTHPDVGLSVHNLAVMYHLQGSLTTALPLYQRSLGLLEPALGAEHPLVATVLNNLAELYRAQSNYGAALPLYQRSLAIREKVLGTDHPDVATSLNNLAELYRVQGNYGAALPLYQRSIALRQRTLGGEHPYLALSLANLAKAYWAQGMINEALTALNRALEIEEVNLSRNLVVGSEEYKRNYLATFQDSTNTAISFHLQGNPQNPAVANLALTTMLRRKGRLLDVLAATASRLRHQLDASGQQQLDELIRVRTQIASLTFVRDRPPPASQISQLEQRANQLEAQLVSQNANFRLDVTPVTLSAVQQAIPANAVLLEFIQYVPYNPKANRWEAPRYALYALKNRGAPQWRDLGTVADLDTVIKAARQRMADPRLPATVTKPSLKAAYERLLAPLEPFLAGSTHLLVAPDGQLNTLSFEALVDRQDRYLVQSYTITLLTSGRDLLRLQQRGKPANPPLVVGNPTFSQGSGRAVAGSQRGVNPRSLDLRSLTFTELPGTATEVKTVSTLLPQAQILTGSSATETTIKQTQRPRVLHLATHGFFLESPPVSPQVLQNTRGLNANTPFRGENPLLRSGLALAGFNQRQSGVDDGVLTAFEVTGINLDGTELVVMSACDTGRGDILNGDGVYGLRRAFTLAGARTQVSSLWKVDDTTTQQLMVAFYQNLAAGKGRSEALRQAQLQLMTDSSKQIPYFWAAFVSSGEWRPLP
ncbi:CHAT domain-containing tetratricopeptide repeat protein [Thermosynechococcus sp. PP551]|uniref:CHAT domain-containing tetratricopeptide repeat protein n=2 Tax=Thermosynechococcus TaxID=146785 RepID=UPI002872DD88|nr:CHAT domain-containing tetratricopeptide repeat protein [Thermosynechococcus sp. PP551]WNC24134.1 CHAT domain-containing tetratricopeptide repeat protein [Thermosynechococcus sp. PP551]